MLLLAIGSRGDVQPLAVLAGALSSVGVDARVVALREYSDVVAQHGRGFVPVDADLSDAIDSTKGPLGRLAAWSVTGQGILLHRWCRRVAAPLADAVLGALRPGESIVTGILSRDVATGAADTHPIVVAASPTLVPPAPDWPATAHQTGFLAAPVPDFDPDDLLAEWLADSAAYAGFGSMTGGGGVDALPPARSRGPHRRPEDHHPRAARHTAGRDQRTGARRRARADPGPEAHPGAVGPCAPRPDHRPCLPPSGCGGGRADRRRGRRRPHRTAPVETRILVRSLTLTPCQGGELEP